LHRNSFVSRTSWGAYSAPPPSNWILRVGQRREGKGRLEGERGGVEEKGGEGKGKGRGRDGTPSKKAGYGPELFDECRLYCT